MVRLRNREDEHVELLRRVPEDLLVRGEQALVHLEQLQHVLVRRELRHELLGDGLDVQAYVLSTFCSNFSLIFGKL